MLFSRLTLYPDSPPYVESRSIRAGKEEFKLVKNRIISSAYRDDVDFLPNPDP